MDDNGCGAEDWPREIRLAVKTDCSSFEASLHVQQQLALTESEESVEVLLIYREQEVLR